MNERQDRLERRGKFEYEQRRLRIDYKGNGILKEKKVNVLMIQKCDAHMHKHLIRSILEEMIEKYLHF